MGGICFEYKEKTVRHFYREYCRDTACRVLPFIDEQKHKTVVAGIIHY